MTEEPGRLQSMGSQSDLACICIAKSLHCPSEAITTLLISYTPIQNKEFGRKEAAELGLPKLSKHLYASQGVGSLRSRSLFNGRVLQEIPLKSGQHFGRSECQTSGGSFQK